MERIRNIRQQFFDFKNTSIGTPGVKNPNDVVFISAIRTPHTKAKKGELKDTSVEELLAHVLKETIRQTGLNPMHIHDIIVGNVLQPGAGAFPARMAELMSDFPIEVPISTVNRFCSSGLESCALIAAKIKAGFIDVGIGAGVESMSLYDMKTMTSDFKFGEQVKQMDLPMKCLLPMGMNSDILAKKYGVTRKELDEFALSSHKKAHYASKNGYFKNEIVPIQTILRDKNGSIRTVIVSQDGEIRGDSKIEGLAKLKPVFTKDGLTTPGNSSQMSDGASAVLLMRRSVAEKLGLKIIGKFVSHAVIGTAPDLMGVGPSEAIPLALNACGLSKNDIDIFDINEAFASVVVFTIKKLGLDETKVNPKGGAISFGHPLGSTGCRQIATVLTELKRTDKRYGVISMCIGTGMGAASVIENE